MTNVCLLSNATRVDVSALCKMKSRSLSIQMETALLALCLWVSLCRWSWERDCLWLNKFWVNCSLFSFRTDRWICKIRKEGICKKFTQHGCLNEKLSGDFTLSRRSFCSWEIVDWSFAISTHEVVIMKLLSDRPLFRNKNLLQSFLLESFLFSPWTIDSDAPARRKSSLAFMASFELWFAKSFCIDGCFVLYCLLTQNLWVPFALRRFYFHVVFKANRR